MEGYRQYAENSNCALTVVKVFMNRITSLYKEKANHCVGVLSWKQAQ